MQFKITDRFGTGEQKVLVWDDVEGRAGVGRIGYQGRGVPMLEHEKVTFREMHDGGETKRINTNQVFEIFY